MEEVYHSRVQGMRHTLIGLWLRYLTHADDQALHQFREAQQAMYTAEVHFLEHNLPFALRLLEPYGRHDRNH